MTCCTKPLLLFLMMVVFMISFEKKLCLARKLGVSNFFGVHFGCEPQPRLTRKVRGSFSEATFLQVRLTRKVCVSLA